jgi:hypothetical protein
MHGVQGGKFLIVAHTLSSYKLDLVAICILHCVLQDILCPLAFLIF